MGWGQQVPLSLLTWHLQVVAVVMDMFTDVDLLSEVLEAAARRVPVYILLDEMNAQLFLDMAEKCRVNLHHVDVSECAGGVDRKRPWQKPDSPPSPVPARAHCGWPHLLLPHWEVFQGPREREVPACRLCRGDERELQVCPAECRSLPLPSRKPPWVPPPLFTRITLLDPDSLARPRS